MTKKNKGNKKKIFFGPDKDYVSPFIRENQGHVILYDYFENLLI